MTNPNKVTENSSHSPMTVSAFNEELQKESPELFQKIHEADANTTILSSEKNFLDELKKHAPNLYEKLKSSNFKFKLDQPMVQDWLDMIDHTKSVTNKLKQMENPDSKQGSNK